MDMFITLTSFFFQLIIIIVFLNLSGYFLSLIAYIFIVMWLNENIFFKNAIKFNQFHNMSYRLAHVRLG
jgi:hypothetical protein